MSKMTMKLSEKGQSAEIESNNVQATLYWESAVDLDLYCYYKLKGSEPVKKKGFLGKLFGSNSNNNLQTGMGRINYSNKGSLLSLPFIQLDKDAGVGDKIDGVVANEENIKFSDLSKIEYAIIVANIFNKNTNFSQYNGKVTIHCKNQAIEVPLSETKTGSWCVVALINNSGLNPSLINVNKTTANEPMLSEFI